MAFHWSWWSCLLPPVRCCHAVLLLCVWGGDWRRGRCAFRGDQRTSDLTVQGDDLVMRCAAVLDWSLQKRWQANVQRAAGSHGERRRQWGQRSPVASRGSRSPQPLSDRWVSLEQRTPHKCWRRRKQHVKASIQQKVWLRVSGRAARVWLRLFSFCDSSSESVMAVCWDLLIVCLFNFFFGFTL